MITAGARLSIERLPLSRILVCEARPRYPSMVLLYVKQLHECPHDDPGVLRVKPSREYRGLYVLDDGYHRYVAHIIVGRHDALCLVIDEQGGAPCP